MTAPTFFIIVRSTIWPSPGTRSTFGKNTKIINASPCLSSTATRYSETHPSGTWCCSNRIGHGNFLDKPAVVVQRIRSDYGNWKRDCIGRPSTITGCSCFNCDCVWATLRWARHCNTGNGLKRTTKIQQNILFLVTGCMWPWCRRKFIFLVRQQFWAIQIYITGIPIHTHTRKFSSYQRWSFSVQSNRTSSRTRSRTNRRRSSYIICRVQGG